MTKFCPIESLYPKKGPGTSLSSKVFLLYQDGKSSSIYQAVFRHSPQPYYSTIFTSKARLSTLAFLPPTLPSSLSDSKCPLGRGRSQDIWCTSARCQSAERMKFFPFLDRKQLPQWSQMHAKNEKSPTHFEKINSYHF